jgi:two-component system, NarL family, nitrate/nitrite response regulator NarL
MSVAVQGQPEPIEVSARILVAGSDLLAGALARALEAHGFTTRHVLLREPEIARGIEWQPNLVLLDARSLDVTFGSALISDFRRAGPRVCVIDAVRDGNRLHVWRSAGASALIDRSDAALDQLFRTVSRLLRMGTVPKATRRSSTSLELTNSSERRQEVRLKPFALLTEREQVVLAELMEGHCAEEIANAASVSISTIRSQIKAILQKLGVNSQLAAVALARRAEWSLDSAPVVFSKPSNSRSSAPGDHRCDGQAAVS